MVLMSNNLPRKTFIIGFVATMKSTLEMANDMFSIDQNPFKYLLTYKFSQDHIELLFSCIRSRGGWNNNPNSLQLKYALRKMLLRNAVAASKNANCETFADNVTTPIIPFFHQPKHSLMLVEKTEDITKEECLLLGHLQEAYKQSEYVQNVLFYIGGYIVSKLIKQISCSQCRHCLISNCSASQTNEINTARYNEASAFTQFVNNGGLTIPQKSFFSILVCAEKVFKCYLCNVGITNQINLRSKMILEVCQYFIVDQGHLGLFDDHEEGNNEILFEDDHKIKLLKYIANKYFILRLFTYGKRYCESVIQQGKPSDRFNLTKLILFKNQ